MASGAGAFQSALQTLNRRSARHSQKLYGSKFYRTKWERKPKVDRWKLVKGDKVEVINGTEKGKQGVILKVARNRSSVIVSGVNMKKRVVPATPERRGTYLTQESLVHYSRLMLVDPTTGQKTKIERQKLDGETVRVSRLSGTVIPKPDALKRIKPRKTNVLTDTPADLVLERTYTPNTYPSADTEDKWIRRMQELKEKKRKQDEEKQWGFLPEYFRKQLEKRREERRALGLNYFITEYSDSSETDKSLETGDTKSISAEAEKA
eukprot:gb/GEZN01013861.1/.p1 GENE.gb/GEZN01013861.1/~~gb/GEZN01013861.1/.p1  ORF type:complete len:264 (+),score=44.43 gb/GEZN01013861.1/:36-827(+)